MQRAVAAGDPFYLYAPFNHIHAPNSCAAEWCGKSARGPVGDAVEEVDWAVGQLMAALKASGADDNTLTFFTSDNGAPLGKPDGTGESDFFGNLPLRGGKAQTWEGSRPWTTNPRPSLSNSDHTGTTIASPRRSPGAT